jgi:putative peptidoglycan lipid II flippase
MPVTDYDDELDAITAPVPVALGPVRMHSDLNDVPTSPTPGTVLGGRYRLLVACGTEPLVQFWQGIDLTSGWLVGLSLIDVDGDLPVERVNEILSRTVRLRGLDVRGIAPIADVLHTGEFGVVVCEWVPGGTLREVSDTAPSPTAVAAALESLIVAADVAHRAGSTLSINSPHRIRISTDGYAVLAFAAAMPNGTVRDDMRGIGGVLYALLVDRWPAQDPMPGGWTAADVDEAGWPKEPAAVDHDIPFLISSAAAGLLRPAGGVDNAATLLSLLRHPRKEAESPPQGNGLGPREMVRPALPPPGRYASFRNVDTAQVAKRVRQQVMKTMLVASAAIFLLAVLSLGSTLNRVLGENDDTIAMEADQLGLAPNTAPSDPQPSPPEIVRQAADALVIPTTAVVFSPDGSPDNPDSAVKAIDRDAATAWSTDRYHDADPFPKFKQGLGLLLQLPRPASLASVSIDLKTAGTVVQIRSARTDKPGALDDTDELSAPTPLQPGPNRIPLSTGPQVSTVLVWISTLGSTDGHHRAEISEIMLSTTARA